MKSQSTSGLGTSYEGAARRGTRAWRRSLATSGIVLLPILTGCMVGPDYQKPDAPVNDAWLSQTATATPTDTASVRWWESFKDPTLSALVQKAYEQNLSIKSAGLRVIEARARRGIAVGRFFAQSQEVFGGIANRQLSYNAAGTGTETAFSDAQIGLQAAWGA
jgi:outer membrane protein TolC